MEQLRGFSLIKNNNSSNKSSNNNHNNNNNNDNNNNNINNNLHNSRLRRIVLSVEVLLKCKAAIAWATGTSAADDHNSRALSWEELGCIFLHFETVPLRSS